MISEQSVGRATLFAGPFLVLGLYALALAVYYSLVFDLLFTLHLAVNRPELSIGLLVVSTWVMFNLVFNYSQCVLTNPGNTQHFQAKYGPYQDILIPLQPNQKQCSSCDVFRVQRSHHCNVCNTCVYKMDHHCRI